MNPRGYINMAFVLQRFSNLPGWSFFASVVMILMRIPASPADGETLPNLGMQCDTINYWLLVWNMAFMTFHILGISSSQLTFTPSFFRGVG